MSNKPIINTSELAMDIIDVLELNDASPDEGLEALNIAVASACLAGEEHYNDGAERLDNFCNDLVLRYASKVGEL